MNIIFRMLSKWLLAKAYPLIQSGVEKILARAKEPGKGINKEPANSKTKKAKSTKAKGKEDAAPLTWRKRPRLCQEI